MRIAHCSGNITCLMSMEVSGLDMFVCGRGIVVVAYISLKFMHTVSALSESSPNELPCHTMPYIMQCILCWESPLFQVITL